MHAGREKSAIGKARVAALVTSDIAPYAAADKLGIIEDTGRIAPKRVFSKVGVSRQSERASLMGLVLR